MAFTASLFATLLILFFAGLTKSTLGFGEALIAIPLLTITLGIQRAAPLAGLVGLTLAAIIAVRNWQGIDFRITGRLLLAAAIGVPLGVWGLKVLPETLMTAGMGIVLIATGLFNLFAPTMPTLEDSRWSYLFGLFAGMLGGAYSTAGPPVVVYGALRRWSPAHFRVTLQGFFLPMSVLIVFGHMSAGLWTKEVLQIFLLSLPLLLLAYWLGARLNRAISPQQFERLVYGGITLLGAMLLI